MRLTGTETNRPQSATHPPGSRSRPSSFASAGQFILRGVSNREEQALKDVSYCIPMEMSQQIVGGHMCRHWGAAIAQVAATAAVLEIAEFFSAVSTEIVVPTTRADRARNRTFAPHTRAGEKHNVAGVPRIWLVSQSTSSPGCPGWRYPICTTATQRAAQKMLFPGDRQSRRKDSPCTSA